MQTVRLHAIRRHLRLLYFRRYRFHLEVQAVRL